MINTTKLQEIVTNYEKQCYKKHKQPTYKGLGVELNITGTTISHIVKGMYKDGMPYTIKPHPTRCIRNEDFKIIRDLYM